MVDPGEAADLRLVPLALGVLEAADLRQGIDEFVTGITAELGLTRAEVDLDAGARPASSELEVPLVRGGRTVGALRATPGRELTDAELAALRKAGDVLAVAIDHDRLLRAEQATVARLTELADLKTAFLGSVSHELRTSVTAIEGFAMLLSRQSARLTDEQRDDFVNRIRRNARSLGTMVEDLLDMARLEGAGMNVSMQPVELSPFVPKVVDQMASILDDHVVVLDVAPGVTARCDPGAIERILVNLLANAAKYTPSGTEVVVGLAVDATDCVLTVADRGPGIPGEERTRIFERFYRIDNESAARVRGVGIGLALVDELVGLHHGTVEVHETPGGGATFVVRWPLGT